MVKTTSNFPVRGVPGGWRDAWSAPDDAALARAQFAAWETTGLRHETGPEPARPADPAQPEAPTTASLAGDDATGALDRAAPKR